MSGSRIRGLGGLFCGVALLLSAACGAGTDAAPGSQAGGTLTFATDSDPGCLDPQQSPFAASQLVSRPVVDSLVAQDPRTGALQPWLATSWQAAPDATSFTFVIRDGVTFSDGTPLDAAAVKANLDRIVDPGTKSLLAAGLLAGYRGTTVDGRSATVTFAQPNAGFLQAASTAFLGMLSPAAFAAGPQAMCTRPVGSGPFVVTGRVAQQSVTLSRRPDYGWSPPGTQHTGPAHLDAVDISVVPQNGVRVGSLRTGQTDAAGNLPPSAVDELPGLQVLTKAQPGLAYSIVVNATRAPWSDPALRQALVKSIDTDRIVDTVYQGRYPRATSVLTPTTPGYADVLKAGRFDLDGARQALDAAGWRPGPDGIRVKDGQALTLEWIYISPAREQRDLVAQLVAEQLKQAGIAVTLTPLPAGEVTARTAAGNWQLNDISFARADGDVLRTVLTSARSGFPAAQAPQVQIVLADAAATTDQARRNGDYAQAQQLIVDQASSIPVYDPTYLLGASNAVRGLAFDPQGLPSFYDTWLAR